MINFFTALACIAIGAFCAFIYLKGRAEAKDEGLVSDEYIENNEEEESK